MKPSRSDHSSTSAVEASTGGAVYVIKPMSSFHRGYWKNFKAIAKLTLMSCSHFKAYSHQNWISPRVGWRNCPHFKCNWINSGRMAIGDRYELVFKQPSLLLCGSTLDTLQQCGRQDFEKKLNIPDTIGLCCPISCDPLHMQPSAVCILVFSGARSSDTHQPAENTRKHSHCTCSNDETQQIVIQIA